MEQNSQPPIEKVEVRPTTPAPLMPHRGALILVLGILGIIVCFICGIIAWVMGNNDLREMDAGRMDPAGRGLTQAGKICGIISVILLIAGMAFGLLFMLLGIMTAAMSR